MSAPSTSSRISQATPAAPPSAAEVQRKLSVHAQSPPSHKRKGSLSKSPTLQSALSAGEVEIDQTGSSPPNQYGINSTADPSAQHQATLPATVQQAQLSVIAERPGGNDEETEDDEDDDWNPPAGRSLEELETLSEEVSVKAGYLLKKGERRKTWKKRWFVLRQTQLSYYKSAKEYKLLMLLPLSEVHSVTPVTLKRHSHTFGIVTPARTYYVQADTAAEADSWVRALNEAKARMGGAPTTSSTLEGRAKPPPAINIQRSTPVPIPSNEPRTPPAQGQPSSPWSPGNHQQHLTSSDSEDQDTFAPSSPVVATSIKFNMPPHPQGSPETEQQKTTILQGYLMKCGSKRKHWRKRYFVLTPEKLLYAKSHMEFTAPKPGKNIKAVPLNAILDALECAFHKGHGLGLTGDKSGAVGMATSASMPSSSFGAPPPTPSAAMAHSATFQPGTTSNQQGTSADATQLPHTFKIVTPKRPLVLCAPSEEEEIKWLSAVRALIARRNGNTISSTDGATGTITIPVTPSKRSARREMAGSSSSSPPRGDYAAQPTQQGTMKRKDSTSLSGAFANAMTISAGSS